MPDVRVRNLESWVLDALKVQAKKNGKTLESELRGLICDAATRSKRELAESLRGFLQTATNASAPPTNGTVRPAREPRK